MAVQLAKQGAKLILTARREEVLYQVAQELKPTLLSSGGMVQVLRVDLSDLESLPGKAEQALAMYGGVIDVLVNNSEIMEYKLARETALQKGSDIMNVNFLSAVALTKSVLPSMRARKYGMIINMKCILGKSHMPCAG